MCPKPQDDYTPYPTQLPDTETRPNPRLDVRATSDAFGGQVGEAMQRAGGQVQQVGSDLNELAIKQQGMINETLSTNAETKYISELGSLEGKYKSLEGLDAVSARPQYVADVAALRQKYRDVLPGGAAKSFDMLALRHEGRAIYDANTYAAAQIRQADYQSSAIGIATSVTSAGTAPVATDDHRFGQTLGDITAHAVRQFQDAPGIRQDATTGKVSFSDTPEAKQSEESFTDALNAAKGQAWENRFKTLADIDTFAAWDKYQQSKEAIPVEAQLKLNAYFHPKIMDATARQDTDAVLKEANAVHKQQLYGSLDQPSNLPKAPAPSSTASTPSESESNFNSTLPILHKHEGGYVAIDGASGAPAIYGINAKSHPAEYAEAKRLSDTEGDAAGQKYADGFYKKEYWDKLDIGSLPREAQSIVMDGAINHTQGFTKQLIDAAKNGATPQQLLDMRKGEYDRLIRANPSKYQESYNAWMERLDSFKEGGNTTAPQDQNVGPLNNPPSQADYYRKNYSQILDRAAQLAEQAHPGNIRYSETVRAKTEQRMNDAMRQEEMKYKADENLVQRAFSGDLSNGKRPTSVEDMIGQNPDVKAAWDRMQVNNPQAAANIENRILTSNGGSHDAKEYGSGFYKLFQSVHASVDSPERITNPSQLYQHIGPDGDLTMAGLDKLTKEIGGRGTPEGESESKMRDQTFKTIKQMLSGEDDGLHLKDPKGERIYAHALPILYQALEDGKSKGIPASELYDPESKNWIGNSVKGLKRSLAQQTNDMMTDADTGQAINSERTLTSIIQDVQSGKISGDAGKAEAMKLGLIRSDEPSVPVSQ